MAVISPTVLANNAHQFREQIERVAEYAPRIHLDFTDGVFTKNTSFPLGDAWIPQDLQVDLHIMHKYPERDLEMLIRLKPGLVVVHAEAEGDFIHFAAALMAEDIQVGVALLANTPVSKVASVLPHIKHVLIFSGDLGSFGGKVDFDLLRKVDEARAINPNIEIGWDGGINDTNIARLANSGIDVLNVGGFIQRSENPQASYEKLLDLI